VRFFDGKYEEAVRQFEQATQLQPSNPINWGNLGDALWQLPGKRDRAREAFAKADVLVSEQLNLDPISSLRKFRAVYLIKLGRNAEALAEIRRAIERQPKDAEVQFFAARVYASADMQTQAIQALKNAVEFGYSAGEIEREPDFARLRQDRTFQQLVAGYAK
jgi:tetratricopeptide (TPR) repeat protein